MKIQRAKAQLAAALPVPEQIKQTREHLKRIEDDMQATTDEQEAATEQLRQLRAKSRQLTSIVRDLREELSESEADDETSDDQRPQPSTPKSSTRSGTPHPRRHRGHIGAPSPELDQVSALKKQLRDLRRQMAKQAERAEQSRSE